MTKVDRRHFLMSSVALPVTLKASVLPSQNDTVRVAVVGFNGRGRAHISAYLKIPNVEIAAFCDVDQAVVENGCKMIEAAGKKRPATFADIRKVLEDQSIDAVSLATPNFHHTLQTIWAVQAGKDVFVEKPCSYNMFEAQQIIAASRKYNRIVQDGTGAQAWLHEAKKRLKEGIIGDVYMARGLCFKWRDTIGRAKEEPVPAGVAYDLWTGPAPAKPFTRNRFHYNWHWQWDYGNGDIGNQGAHQIHAARMALGVKYPTQNQLDGRALHVRRRPGNAQHISSRPSSSRTVARRSSSFSRCATGSATTRRASVNDQMRRLVPRRGSSRPSATSGTDRRATWRRAAGGWRTFMGQEQAPGPKSEAGAGVGGFVNFIDVLRSRKREDQLSEIEEGAISTMLIHLANISYRTGRTLYFDPVTYSCKGDAEATAMFTRNQYRSPFVVPNVSGRTSD